MYKCLRKNSLSKDNQELSAWNGTYILTYIDDILEFVEKYNTHTHTRTYMVYTGVLIYMKKKSIYNLVNIYNIYKPIVTTQEQSMFKFMKCYNVLILTIQT